MNKDGSRKEMKLPLLILLHLILLDYTTSKQILNGNIRKVLFIYFSYFSIIYLFWIAMLVQDTVRYNLCNRF